MGSCSSSKSKDNKNNDAKADLKVTQKDINLIKQSWKFVVQTGLAVYGTNMMVRIFLEHKELKPMWRFAKNLETEEQMTSNQMLKAHGEKLFNAIDMAINSLDDLNNLTPILVQLGYSHFNWGVKDEHFSIIANMLIQTLQDGLKDKFTPKIKKAWVKVFWVLANPMITGLKQAENDSKSIKNNIQQIEIQVNDLDLNNNNVNSNKVFPNGNNFDIS